MTLTDLYWTPKELNEQLRGRGLASSSRSLARWELKKQGPPRTQIGGRTVYRVEAVIQWLRSREQQSARRKRRGSK